MTQDAGFVPEAGPCTSHLVFFPQRFCKSTSFTKHTTAFTLIWELLLGPHSNFRLNSLSITHISYFNGGFDSICHFLISPPTVHALRCYFPSLYVSSQHFIIMGIPISVSPHRATPSVFFFALALTLMKTIILQSADVGLLYRPALKL